MMDSTTDWEAVDSAAPLRHKVVKGCQKKPPTPRSGKSPQPWTTTATHQRDLQGQRKPREAKRKKRLGSKKQCIPRGCRERGLWVNACAWPQHTDTQDHQKELMGVRRVSKATNTCCKPHIHVHKARSACKEGKRKATKKKTEAAP